MMKMLSFFIVMFLETHSLKLQSNDKELLKLELTSNRQGYGPCDDFAVQCVTPPPHYWVSNVCNVASTNRFVPRLGQHLKLSTDNTRCSEAHAQNQMWQRCNPIAALYINNTNILDIPNFNYPADMNTFSCSQICTLSLKGNLISEGVAELVGNYWAKLERATPCDFLKDYTPEKLKELATAGQAKLTKYQARQTMLEQLPSYFSSGFQPESFCNYDDMGLTSLHNCYYTAEEMKSAGYSCWELIDWYSTEDLVNAFGHDKYYSIRHYLDNPTTDRMPVD